MPFKSDKQRKYLFKFKPGVARQISKDSYQMGGLQEYQGAATLGTSLLDTLIPTNEFGVRSDVGATGMGALQGAGIGSVFGPAGAVVGGLAGGVSSLFGNRKRREEQRELEEEQRMLQVRQRGQQSAQRLANYDRYGMGRFKKGGNLDKYLVDGGELEQISQDAVRVQGDRPEMVDDVDIGIAYVDNDEVIDNQDRVFSDSIPYGEGTIADEAARLEGMKSNRFPMQNRFLNTRMNNLFEYQEATKMEKGGKIKKEKDQKGRTPGEASFEFKERFSSPDPRFRVPGGGGGVERTPARQLDTASKKTVRKSRKMNKAGGRKEPKRKYQYGGNVGEFAKDLMKRRKKPMDRPGFSLRNMMK